MVALYVAVAEGQRRVLRDLSIAGTVKTSTKTVSDLAGLRFGDPVSPALVSDLQKRLYDSGVFSHVTVDFTPAPPGPYQSKPYDDPVVAKVTVQEAPRYALQYGLQVSRTLDATGTESEYKPGASLDFRDRNFLGRAMSLGIGGRVDARQTSGRATFALPRTYGTSIRSYLFLDRSTETDTPQDGYSVEDHNKSITAEQRWKARRGYELSWSLAYDFRKATLQAVTKAGTTELLRLAGDTVGPRLAVVWDRRDDPFDTKRGWFHSEGIDQSDRVRPALQGRRLAQRPRLRGGLAERPRLLRPAARRPAAARVQRGGALPDLVVVQGRRVRGRGQHVPERQPRQLRRPEGGHGMGPAARDPVRPHPVRRRLSDERRP
jgi:outer membrane translocation and assembly module TamA